MADEKNININNSNVQGGIINIGGTQHFHDVLNVTFSAMSTSISTSQVSEGDKNTLKDLLSELENALKDIPTEKQTEATLVAKRASEVVDEISTAKPDKEAVDAKVNLLKKAANNIAEALPVVFNIAVAFIAQIQRLKLG